MSWQAPFVDGLHGTLVPGQKVRVGIMFWTEGYFSGPDDGGAQILMASPLSPGGEITTSEQTKHCKMDGNHSYSVLLTNTGTMSTTWILQGGSFQ